MNNQFLTLKVICDLDKWDFCGMEGTDSQLKWVDERMGGEEMKAVKITREINCLFCRRIREMGAFLHGEGGDDATVAEGTPREMTHTEGKFMRCP